MENYGFFGTKLRVIRKELNQTQEAFCDGICSLRQYKRIETGVCEPTLFVLNSLSSKYNLDFITLYKQSDRSRSDNDFSFTYEMNEAIKANDLAKVNELFSSYSQIFDHFGNFAKMLWYYGKALLEKDIDTSIDYAITGLRYETPVFSDNPDSYLNANVYSNISLCLLNVIAFNQLRKGNHELAAAIYKRTIFCVENLISFGSSMYQSTEFVYTYYPSVISNLCIILSSEGKFEEALSYTDKAIDYVTANNHSSQLHILLWKKYELLKKLGREEDSDIILNAFETICTLFGHTDYLNEKMSKLN